MPSCCVGCKIKGRLFRFPTNIERRNQWLSNCSSFTKEHWKYSSNAKLCENHFDEDQFEQKRLDLKKKLKPCAVPTLFVKNQNVKKKITTKVKLEEELNCEEEYLESFSDVDVILKEEILESDELSDEKGDEKELSEPKRLKRKEQKKTPKPKTKILKKKPAIKKKTLKKVKTKDISECENDGLRNSTEAETAIPMEILEDEMNLEQNGKLIIANGYSQIILECDVLFNENYQNKTIEKTVKTDVDSNVTLNNPTTGSTKKEESSFEREMRYMCNMKQLENENKKLTKMMQCLEKFLHKEQMELLLNQENNGKIHKWSKECILTCLKLKSVLGWDGYRHLLSMGYPGPCQSTLGKYLQQYQGEIL